MNPYQFERIAVNLSKKYGKIRKGEESGYEYPLFAIENNLLIKHRQNPSCSAVQAKEGIMLALHTINGYMTGQTPGLEPFMSESNVIFRDAVLSAFDPFSNEKILHTLNENGNFDREDKTCLETFFQPYVKCMIRILDSIEIWNKNGGSNGYFTFLEDQIGRMVKDDEMKYAVATKWDTV